MFLDAFRLSEFIIHVQREKAPHIGISVGSWKK